jgi:hypothetical protein
MAIALGGWAHLRHCLDLSDQLEDEERGREELKESEEEVERSLVVPVLSHRVNPDQESGEHRREELPLRGLGERVVRHRLEGREVGVHAHGADADDEVQNDLRLRARRKEDLASSERQTPHRLEHLEPPDPWLVGGVPTKAKE